MKENKLSIDALKLNRFGLGKSNSVKEISNNDIAIIGISTRFPKADNIEEFWDIINNNIDCVSDLPEDRKNDIDNYLRFKGASQDDFRYIKSAYIEEIDKFDYSFFNLTPNEAKLMDPVQRIFLEVVWNAIEDAGYSEKMISGSNVGIYMGHISDLEGYKYKQMIYEVDPDLLPFSLAGTLTSIIPSRISYLLNLKGPSIVIDTACSSSLVAVDLACQALRNGTCDMAVIGSVRLNILPFDKECFKVGIESSDNLTRTFDQGGDGSGMGEGAAAILIKQLGKARRDGDNIYAVIKGIAVNQDGRSMGITAPNPSAQTDVIIKAWENSGIDPKSISYIDTHGTATKLGDPIEIEGIRKAFEKYTKEKQFCAVGSVKSNIGHLYDCAGLAGLIKAILALKHKTIPPSVHFNRPNSKIDFNDSPVYVNIKSRKWDCKNTLMRCGVSSFGLSGTNCHVVLEEYPESAAEYLEDTGSLTSEGECIKETFNVLTLSAKSLNSLRLLVRNYKELADQGVEKVFDNLCYTANTGRGQYFYRLAIVLKDARDFREKMNKIFVSELESLNGPLAYFGVCKAVPANKEHLKPGEIREDEINKLNKTADEKIREFDKMEGCTSEVLQELCVLYTSGATIDWEQLYRGKNLKRMSLPVYPFERSRCWLEIPDTSEMGKEEFYYAMEWQLDNRDNSAAIVREDSVMVMGLWDELVQELRECGRDVIEVKPGTEYRKIDSNTYIISGLEEDYKKLIDDTKEKELSQIIHLFTVQEKQEVTSLNELEESQKRGVFSLFYLYKAIHGSEIEKEIDVVLISKYVNKVTGEEEQINPENSSMFGLGKAVRKEHPNILCRCIDIDRHTDISQIIAGINSGENFHQIALRKGKRYIEVLTRVDSDTLHDEKTEIRDGGVYLITGGTGGIGIEVASFIASKNKVKLVLVSRSGMPDRTEWKEITDAGIDTKLISKIRRINEIEASGSEVAIYSVDVSNMNEMRNMLDEVREKYGRIIGVIHGAGFVTNKALIDKDISEFEKVLSPKVKGTWILDVLTRQDNPEFFVLFSSIATIFDTINQGDYIAANSYMDSYSFYRRMKAGKTLAIDWSTWRDAGFAAEQNFGIDTLFKAISIPMALTGFENILNKNISRVLIGEMNFESKIILLLDKCRFTLSPEICGKLEECKKSMGKGGKSLRKKSTGKVKLLGRDSEGYTEIEKEIAQICKDTLGFEEIDINETFFELGADSISMKRIYQTVEKLYPGEIAVADLFEYPTIYKLAGCIAERRGIALYTKSEKSSTEKKDIDKELNDIFEDMQKGNLTIEQVVNNLSNM